MWEYPHETTIDKAYEALKYMEDTHSENQPEKELREARAEKYGNIGWHRYHTGCPVKEGTLQQNSTGHNDEVCGPGDYGLSGSAQHPEYILCAAERVFIGRETEVYKKSL